MSTLSDEYLFVVAIDFGTTYSGYAFSSRDDFTRDPLKIVANQAWNAGSQRHLSLKTPTCILLDDNEELVSFGYEAENKYADVVLEGEQSEYFYFQRFKMQLYKNEDIKGEMIIEDVTGKPPIDKLQGAAKGFCMTEDGTQYMVVDNGGGTADITVHQKISEGNLKEICRASGGDCGGTSIDNSFYQIFVKLVGAPLLNMMKQEDPSAYLDIFRELEAVKRTVDKSKEDKVTMTIPRAVLDDICKKHLHEDFKSVIEASPYKDRMELRYDKLRIKVDLIKNLFAQASKKIIQLIGDATIDVKSNDVDILLLVGGFSECKVIQENIKASFPNKRIIVPENAGLAVLKGAVLFGHKPEYIVSRIVRYTYGVEVLSPFNPNIHDKHRLTQRDGKDMCKNIFSPFVKRGSVVKLGEKIQENHLTSKEFQKAVTFAIFQSPMEYPFYTDEDECKLLGKVRIKIPVPSKEEQSFSSSMIFGHTELKYTVFNRKTGKECQAVLDLI